MKELKFGSYALMGKDKHKRIYSGYANGKHHAVHSNYEEEFMANEDYEVWTWDSAEPIEEPIEDKHPIIDISGDNEIVLRNYTGEIRLSNSSDCSVSGTQFVNCNSVESIGDDTLAEIVLDYALKHNNPIKLYDKIRAYIETLK